MLSENNYQAHIAVMAAIVALFGHSHAKARELYPGQYANAPHKEWFAAQRNKAGGSCCDHADAHPFFGDYKFTENGCVEFDADDGHHTLPAYMLLDGPNPTGSAQWWYIDWQTDIGTIHSDYCFAPGAGG